MATITRSALVYTLAGLTAPLVAYAQTSPDFPTKPIRYLTQSAPGGGSDTTARALANKLTQIWGQQVIVDNRPGASGAIVYDVFQKATPDGYAIMMITATHVINSLVIPDWPDINKLFAPVSQITSLFYVVYNHPSVPFKSIQDLVAYARANPGKLPYGTGGNASISHLGWELFAHTTGIKLKHVHYKGAALSITATVAGEMKVGFATLLSMRPHLSSGRANALAVTSAQRSPALPDVPTVAESGLPGYVIDQWYGVATHAAVPPAVVNKLNAGFVEAVKAPDVAQRLAADGSTPVGSSSAEFRKHVRSEVEKWRKVLQDTGVVLSGAKK